MKITREQLKAILVEEVAKALDEEHAGMHDMHSPMAKVCTGKNFGSEKCPPGSKRYNLAKTFRKMAKDRKKD